MAASQPLKCEKVPPMPTARTFCQAFNAGNDVFLVGGCDIKGIALGTFESIDLRQATVDDLLMVTSGYAKKNLPTLISLYTETLTFYIVTLKLCRKALN